MTDERTELRALLDAVCADPPPTRLTVDGICATARRAARRPVRDRLRRLPVPSRRLVRRVATVAAVLVGIGFLPGLIVLGLMTEGGSVNTAGSGGGGGGGGGSAASSVAHLSQVPAGYRGTGACDPDTGAGPMPCTIRYRSTLPDGASLQLGLTQTLGPKSASLGLGGPGWDAPTSVRVHGMPAQLRLGHQPGKHPGQVWYTRELRWTEHGVTLVLSNGIAESADRLLPATELLRVADGVRW